ncbi:hypothetical protein ACFLQN_00085 [Candidatus Aenigmatarchaeota archaeon]
MGKNKMYGTGMIILVFGGILVRASYTLLDTLTSWIIIMLLLVIAGFFFIKASRMKDELPKTMKGRVDMYADAGFYFIGKILLLVMGIFSFCLGTLILITEGRVDIFAGMTILAVVGLGGAYITHRCDKQLKQVK